MDKYNIDIDSLVHKISIHASSEREVIFKVDIEIKFIIDLIMKSLSEDKKTSAIFFDELYILLQSLSKSLKCISENKSIGIRCDYMDEINEMCAANAVDILNGNITNNDLENIFLDIRKKIISKDYWSDK